MRRGSPQRTALQTGRSHLPRAGRARCEAEHGFPSGAVLLDDLYSQLDSARGDAARAPLLQELLAAAFAPFAAHLRAWLYGAGAPYGAFGAAPDALAASFFPAGTPASERVRCLTASRVQSGRGCPAWPACTMRRSRPVQGQRSLPCPRTARRGGSASLLVPPVLTAAAARYRPLALTVGATEHLRRVSCAQQPRHTLAAHTGNAGSCSVRDLAMEQ
jgi:hypothetical protein